MVEIFTFIAGSIFSLCAYKTYKLGYKVYPYFFKTNFFVNSNKNTLKIALVSGSTDGLGKCFAKQLFHHGYELILLGRSDEKLENVRKQFQTIRSHHQNQLHKYKIDFGALKLSQGEQTLIKLTQLVQQKKKSPNLNKSYQKIQICVINSCGQSHISQYSYTKLQQIQRLNSVNLNSFHLMAKLIFALKQKISSTSISTEYFFVNVSSGIDHFPSRYSSIYSGAKSCCSALMKALSMQAQCWNKESSDSKMYCLNLTPLYVRTKMVRYLKQWDVAEPQKVVQGAFKLLKYRSQGAGYFLHQILKQFPLIIKKSLHQRVQKGFQINKKVAQLQKKRQERRSKRS